MAKKDISSMSHEELRAYIAELEAKRAKLLAALPPARAYPEPFPGWKFGDALPDGYLDSLKAEERQALLDDLREWRGLPRMTQPAAAPAPEPQTPVKPEPVVKVPTKRMRRKIEKFDAMTDSEQVEHLAGLWGNE